MNSSYSKLEKTLSFSMKHSMVFGSLEATLEIFLISSGNVSDAHEIYSYNLLIDDIFPHAAGLLTILLSPSGQCNG